MAAFGDVNSLVLPGLSAERQSELQHTAAALYQTRAGAGCQEYVLKLQGESGGLFTLLARITESQEVSTYKAHQRQSRWVSN